MNVLIIEDERAAARNLCTLLEDISPDIKVIAIVDSVVDSVEWIENHKSPDLILLDIHLADGSAFDIFDRCTVLSPVVFTTAYDEYALKAFKVNSVDYLLKPICIDELRAAIKKFERLSERHQSFDPMGLNALIASIHSQSHTTHLLIPQGGDKLVPLVVADVNYFVIEDGIVRAVTSGGKSYTVPHTLDQLSEMIDRKLFFRANRQYIVSKSEIEQMALWFGNRLSIKIKSAPTVQIIINKPRVAEFKAWMTSN